MSRLRNYRQDSGFDEMDLGVFLDWMEKTLMPHPGQQEFYLPGEGPLAERLRRLLQFYRQRRSAEVSPEKRAAAVRLADTLRHRPKNV